MSIALFANDAQATIAGSISSSATSVTLTAGMGALFPNPGANQYFCATFVDAATGLIEEIVHVTAVSGDMMTIVRAQEGTTALSWISGDGFGNLWTAGSASVMLQQGQSQQQASNYAVDSGSVNAMVVTLSPVPSTLAALVGAPIRILVAHTNTSSTVTLNVNSLGAQPVHLPSTQTPGIGQYAAGAILEVSWDGTQFQSVNQLTPATTVQIGNGADNQAPVTSLGIFNTFAANHTGSGSSAIGYQKFPNGTIIQWGKINAPTGAGDTVTFPVAFPSAYTLSLDIGGTSNTLPNIAQGDTSSLTSFTLYTSGWSGSAWATISGVGAGTGWMAMGY